MNNSEIIYNLSLNKNIFHSLLNGIAKEQYTWKPTSEKWSLLEVVAHLFDEEREDFRARLKHTLETSQVPMAGINPSGWVTERKYSEWDYERTLHDFLLERGKSIDWLNSLKNPLWTNTYQHPTLGLLSAQMFLNNWLAHDYLHFRQITKLKYDFLKQSGSTGLEYAGSW
jgi:hypothetical protein